MYFAIDEDYDDRQIVARGQTLDEVERELREAIEDGQADPDNVVLYRAEEMPCTIEQKITICINNKKGK